MNAFGVTDLLTETKMQPTNSSNESQRKVCTPPAAAPAGNALQEMFYNSRKESTVLSA